MPPQIVTASPICGFPAVIAKKFGENKSEEARRNFSMIVFIGVLFGIAALILGNLAITPIVRVLGSTPLIEEECVTYLSISLYFSPACMLQMLFQTFFVTALPPEANMIPTAISTFKTGNTILMADKASLPTNLDTKIPSMIVYNDINTIITIDGKANFSNEYNLKS